MPLVSVEGTRPWGPQVESASPESPRCLAKSREAQTGSHHKNRIESAAHRNPRASDGDKVAVGFAIASISMSIYRIPHGT